MRSLLLLGFFLLQCGCASAPRPPQVAPAGEGAALTRDLLAARCGTCHRSDLPTAVPGALAVFDLTEELWYTRISPEQADRLLARLRGLSDLDPADLAVAEAFLGK
jgi:hypothetical protein